MEKNEVLKNENYRLEEELIKLRGIFPRSHSNTKTDLFICCGIPRSENCYEQLSHTNSHTIFTEEVEAGSSEPKQPAVTAVEVEATTKSCDRQFSDVSTNTDPSTRDPCSRGF